MESFKQSRTERVFPVISADHRNACRVRISPWNDSLCIPCFSFREGQDCPVFSRTDTEKSEDQVRDDTSTRYWGINVSKKNRLTSSEYCYIERKLKGIMKSTRILPSSFFCDSFLRNRLGLTNFKNFDLFFVFFIDKFQRNQPWAKGFISISLIF